MINVHHIAQRRLSRVLAIALSVAVALGTVPASAQQRGNPFAGRSQGGFGPYGSDAGAMPHLMQVPQIMGVPEWMEHRRGAAGVVVQRGEAAPEVPETSRGDAWEAMFVGCTAGAFLGGFTAATTTSVVTSGAAAAAMVPAGIALPVLAGAVVSAAAIGCGIGVSTAAVSVGAAALWRWAAR